VPWANGRRDSPARRWSGSARNAGPAFGNRRCAASCKGSMPIAWMRNIGQWVARQQLRPGWAVAVDWQESRRSHDAGQRAPHLLSAILHQEAVVVAPMEVEEKTNEIPKLLALLAPLPLQGTWSRPMPCTHQRRRPRYLGEEKKADYLFIVKDNQRRCAKTSPICIWNSIPPRSTPPSIKVMAAWKSAPSGPARNGAVIWTSPMPRKSSPSNARLRRWLRRNYRSETVPGLSRLPTECATRHACWP